MRNRETESYMQDLYPNIPDIKKAIFMNAPRAINRKVNDLPYQDPDQHCLRLYQEELQRFFLDRGIRAQLTEVYNCYGGEPQPQYVIRHPVSGLQSPVRLTSDYIGPSATSAYHAGLDDGFVWETILKCRTPGGHILWPRMRDGINPSKAWSGSVNRGISDRMDIALYELRNYLDGNESAECYNDRLRAAFAEPVNDAWLRSFDGSGKRLFEAFCDFFMLQDSFVDKNYEIIWLAPKRMGKASKEDVASFFRENTEAVQRRNERFWKESTGKSAGTSGGRQD